MTIFMNGNIWYWNVLEEIEEHRRFNELMEGAIEEEKKKYERRIDEEVKNLKLSSKELDDYYHSGPLEVIWKFKERFPQRLRPMQKVKYP